MSAPRAGDFATLKGGQLVWVAQAVTRGSHPDITLTIPNFAVVNDDVAVVPTERLLPAGHVSQASWVVVPVTRSHSSSGEGVLVYGVPSTVVRRTVFRLPEETSTREDWSTAHTVLLSMLESSISYRDLVSSQVTVLERSLAAALSDMDRAISWLIKESKLDIREPFILDRMYPFGLAYGDESVLTVREFLELVFLRSTTGSSAGVAMANLTTRYLLSTAQPRTLESLNETFAVARTARETITALTTGSNSADNPLRSRLETVIEQASAGGSAGPTTSTQSALSA